MNYGQLKTKIASWINRSDVPLSDVVELAEAEIARDVRVMALEGIVTGSLVGGRFDVPADFLSARQMLIGGKLYTFVSPEMYQREQECVSSARYFTRIADEFLIVGGGTDAYSLTYSAKFAALSADGDTNWLLTNAKDVYLYGALKHAAIWARDVTAAQGYQSVYDAAVARVNASDKGSRFAGSLTVRPRVVA